MAGPCDAASAATAHTATVAHPSLTLAATVLGSSVAFIDGSVVNVALPTLAQSLGAGPSELTWAINAYLLPLGALILLGGGLGDHFGRRRLFLQGLILFTLASLVCAAAPTFDWLLAGRGLQGIGAALLMPNSLAILGGAFRGEARGRAIGSWAAVGALAGALGPVIGGWLVDAAGWRTIFLLNLPIAAGAAYLAWRFVAETRAAGQAASLDWGGAALATAGLGLLTWSLTEASAASGAAVFIWASVAVGVALLVAFVALEHHRADRAIMPLAMFAAPTFVGLTLFTFFLYGALGGLLVLLPFLLIRVAHWTAVAAGAALLPVPIVIGLGSRFMGRVTAKIGGRLPLAVGAAIVGAGLAFYARVNAGAVDYWTDILPPTLLVALGMGACVAPLTTAVMASVDTDHVGAASGFNSAVARIAGLVATALLGFLFAREGSAEGFMAGFRVAALIGGASAALAALCAVAMIHPQQTVPGHTST
ncbi:MAG: DHA2 family efflux MFS transporter permease subunit [Pseudomonadota bacterium]|nr:DHA2 family efflux MFS transporter permease subunit [Pseudomonadota bacterium]